jgi:hypothetical protein
VLWKSLMGVTRSGNAVMSGQLAGRLPRKPGMACTFTTQERTSQETPARAAVNLLDQELRGCDASMSATVRVAVQRAGHLGRLTRRRPAVIRT